MKLIKPTQITSAMLVSSTIPEADAAEWNAATAYSVGNTVIRSSLHRVFERLKAGTTATAPEVDVENWLDIGATNRWRMFDQKVGTVSAATTSFTVVIKPGICTAIALVGISASHVRIKMTDSADGVVFDKTYSLYDPTGINDFWPYFFEDIRRKDTLVVTGLPSYRNAEIEVTISGGSGESVGLGALVAGKSYEFARAVLAGAAAGIQDYSRKEKDDFGNIYLAERAYARRARWDFIISNSDVDHLQRTLAEMRATPAVFIGGGDFDSTVIYGFYRDFDVVIAYPRHSECSIELEGLT